MVTAESMRALSTSLCFVCSQVLKKGTYDATLFYTSKQWAVFKLSVGPYKSIVDGTAPSVTSTLPFMVC